MCYLADKIGGLEKIVWLCTTAKKSNKNALKRLNDFQGEQLILFYFVCFFSSFCQNLVYEFKEEPFILEVSIPLR